MAQHREGHGAHVVAGDVEPALEQRARLGREDEELAGARARAPGHALAHQLGGLCRADARRPDQAEHVVHDVLGDGHAAHHLLQLEDLRTREDLVEAAAWHIHAAREAAFEAEAKKLKPGQDALDGAIDAYWRLLSSIPFAAFLALERAGRQDAEVAKAIAPAQEAFDKAAMGRATPGFIMAGNDARFQASRDLARFALDGMHRAALTYESEARIENVLSVIKKAIHMLNRKGDVTDLWSE